MPEINAYGQPVGDVVPGWQGAQPLPRMPLQGRACRLEPLNAERHSDDLFWPTSRRRTIATGRGSAHRGPIPARRRGTGFRAKSRMTA